MTTGRIHPTALIDPRAAIDSTVVIGPYAVVGPHAQIGPGCQIHAFAQVIGHTVVGADTVIHSHAVVGGIPQDKKYKGEPTRLEIGSRNTIRESCTINCGTAQDKGVTRLGDDNWIMAYVHIAHDCQVGSHTIMANATQLAGHVSVGDWAILGGITGVHQFVRIGAHAMTGAGTTLLQDLPPYVMSSGNPAAPHGLNTEGLRRRGFSADTLAGLKKAYRLVYKSGLGLAEAAEAVQSLAADFSAEGQAALMVLGEFIAMPGRGIVR
ncbi:MAG: acyl-ACP--UDP-N-acetylglucosamine O-acyltransferase [Pseudomonadota bacterium]|jgi:UDP-N-acetylglucosamine acyltransferase